MKKKILTTAILLTGLISASTYNYTFKISDTSLFKESNHISYNTPEERTGVQSTGQILASDGGVDWYGEVSAANLISGDDLATLIGLTAGNSQHSDAGWLHVGLDGTELFIAKRPFRSNISWDNISARNAVYGERIVKISDVNYRIRLMKGANSNQTVFGSGVDLVQTHGSEWNRIFYRLTENRDNKSSEEPFVHLANYTVSNLGFDNNINGYLTLCQETFPTADAWDQEE